MTRREALEIVLELARQNIADQIDNPAWFAQQEIACDIVENFKLDNTGAKA